MSPRRLFWLAPIVFVGCTKYVFEERVPESIKEVNRVVGAVEPQPADILFVVDNSGSMADEQENLARNFGSFIEAIAGLDDYRLAIVTTDLRLGNDEQAGLRTFTYKTTEPYTWLVAQSTAMCSGTGIPHACFRGPDPSLRVITSGMPRDQQIRAFQDNVRVGSCGSGDEQGLEAMKRALEATGTGECNEGFLRQDANLVVVIVSDEEDEDFTGASPSPIESYVTFLQTIKPASKLRVGAIVGSDQNGNAARCNATGATCGSQCDRRPPQGSGAACGGGSQCATGERCANGRCENEDLQFFDDNCWWCSYFNAPDCCSAEAGGRYVQFARAMEAVITTADNSIEVSNCRAAPGERAACLIDSICQEQFDETLKRIARDLIPRGSYSLTPPANYPAGVSVTVKGQVLVNCAVNAQDCDFTVSEDGTTLVITSEKGPGPDDSVEIYYTTSE